MRATAYRRVANARNERALSACAALCYERIGDVRPHQLRSIIDLSLLAEGPDPACMAGGEQGAQTVPNTAPTFPVEGSIPSPAAIFPRPVIPAGAAQRRRVRISQASSDEIPDKPLARLSGMTALLMTGGSCG
jgi:hypothetical protein